jgi:methyl-branched lipid omega-hydroxylase
MTLPATSQSPDDIRLGDPAFWGWSRAERAHAFATLRRERPVSFHEEPEVPGLGRGPGFWSVVRHADVLEVSRNGQLFSSGRGGVNMIDQPEFLAELFGSMIAMDDPKHARLRRIVSSGFTPNRLKNVIADVEHAAIEIIEGVRERGECDFVTDIAAMLPLKIICDMMGIPASEYRYVFDRTNVILGATDPEYVEDLAQAVGAILQAGQELAKLAEDLAGFREKHPTDDLTSVLVHAEIDGERLTKSEIGSFFVLLTAAGNETTRNAISHGMKALADHPDQRKKWMDDFETIAPTAVEEIVRWATPVIHFRRTATADTTIGGQAIRAGEKVVMWYTSADRDERVFDAPERFDVTRTPNDHVGFGGPGPHFCLGAQLARREITVMFRELFRRIPDLEVTGAPAYLASNFIDGIKHLPCAFTPGR